MAGTASDLAAAVLALLPTTVSIAGTTETPKRYDTRTGTTDKPSVVYYVLNVRLPRVLERSEGASPQGHEVRVRLTSVGRSATGARDLASAADAVLDQARPSAAGWLCGPLLLDNARGPDEDPDVVFTNGSTAVFAVSEYVLTCSRTA